MEAVGDWDGCERVGDRDRGGGFTKPPTILKIRLRIFSLSDGIASWGVLSCKSPCWWIWEMEEERMESEAKPYGEMVK